MTLPWEIWLPAGALLLSGGALALFLWLAWDLAPEETRWHERWAAYADLAIRAVIISIVLLIGGLWWWTRPF